MLKKKIEDYKYIIQTKTLTCSECKDTVKEIPNDFFELPLKQDLLADIEFEQIKHQKSLKDEDKIKLINNVHFREEH